MVNRIKSSILVAGLVLVLATPIGFSQAGFEETVFKGCVLTVEDSLGVWSGRIIAFQIVTYEVKEIVSGSFSSPTTVHHSIVMGKSDVGPLDPELNPSIVFPGAGLIVTTVPFEDGVFGSINAAFDPVTPDSSISCDEEAPDDLPVGGEFSPIDTTAILLAGIHMTAAWLIPIVVTAIGFGIVILRKL